MTARALWTAALLAVPSAAGAFVSHGGLRRHAPLVAWRAARRCSRALFGAPRIPKERCSRQGRARATGPGAAGAEARCAAGSSHPATSSQMNRRQTSGRCS
jgi:hypothetical protein